MQVLFVIWSILLIVSFWKGGAGKWFSLANFLGFLAIPLCDTKLVEAVLPNARARIVGLYLLLSVPAYAFALGRTNADLVTTGKVDHTVEHSRLPLELNLRQTPQKPLMYVGALGDRIAFYETLSGHLVLVQADEIPTLAIREK